ncbi:hypothetical protein AVEN_49809-1 [Araneus ventricosus]|uniref:Uncharacterized protein n=1 Tax=Araneus ventricosus TaxID=182803 RepID=A0A4Y2JLY2_ARAVE|nr:hypothetical protein AVEN_49809-1 [Araneus ventricosus]
MTDEVNAEVGTNPVDTVDNGDPHEADKAEIEALMEKASNSEKALNALIATSSLNQAKRDKLRMAKGSDRDRSWSCPKKEFNVIIYPKKDQNSDNTKKDIQSKISPSKISVSANSRKNIKKGGIPINTSPEEDIDKLIDEFKKADSLFENYEISKPKLFNFGSELDENINEISTIFLRFSQQKIVILGDFNAKLSI